jgi:hypothetical protein
VASGIVFRFRGFSLRQRRGLLARDLGMLSKVIGHIAMMALGVGFFVTSVLYVLACERM